MIHNGSKIDQQIDQNQGLGWVWAAKRVLGCVSGGSWAIRGQDGPNLDPTWPKVEAKIAQKSMPKSIIFLMPFRIEILLIFGGLCEESGA